MSEPAAAKTPSDFSLVLTGLMMECQPTKNGAYMLSVACGSTMYKVYSKQNGLNPMQVYKGKLRGFQNGMFFEDCRL